MNIIDLINNYREFIKATGIDPRNITMPLLNIMARYDNFIPNDSSIPLNDAVSSSQRDIRPHDCRVVKAEIFPD